MYLNTKLQQGGAQYTQMTIQNPETQMYPQQSYMSYQQPMVNNNTLPPVYYSSAAPEVYQGSYPILAPVSPMIVQAPVSSYKSGLQLLEEQAGIIIKQKVELIEALTGCETENKYHVYSYDPSLGRKGAQIFKCKEKSDFCSRICLSGGCRPFEMNISTLAANGEYEPFLHLERPCSCTFLCFNRPEIRVTLVESGRAEYLGKVVDPYNFCNMEIDTYDQDNTLKHKVYGSCCQLGVFCRLPCDPCQTIDFDVKSAAGEVVSQVQKKSKGCLQATYTDADNFYLTFPKNISVNEKVLLMSAVLFLDFRHFEVNPNQNRNQGGDLVLNN